MVTFSFSISNCIPIKFHFSIKTTPMSYRTGCVCKIVFSNYIDNWWDNCMPSNNKLILMVFRDKKLLQVYLLCLSSTNKGSNQPSVASIWASKNVIVSPVAAFAPTRRDFIKPIRFLFLKTKTLTGNVFTKSSNGLSK